MLIIISYCLIQRNLCLGGDATLWVRKKGSKTDRERKCNRDHAHFSFAFIYNFNELCILLMKSSFIFPTISLSNFVSTQCAWQFDRFCFVFCFLDKENCTRTTRSFCALACAPFSGLLVLVVIDQICHI